MLKLGLGALLAAIAMFLWGFFFWGSNIIDHFGHMTPEAETALTEALKANLPTHAVYSVPDIKNGTEEETMARASAGPFAIINFHPAGVGGMPETLGMGFAHILIVTLILAYFVQLTAAPAYMDRVKLVAVFGAAAAIYAKLSDPIWWHYPWAFSASAAFYDFLSYVIAGLILAYFITPAKA
jgi:hypothetical protein